MGDCLRVKIIIDWMENKMNKPIDWSTSFIFTTKTIYTVKIKIKTTKKLKPTKNYLTR